jgi:N-acyl-L-homoserine lactone synthetase
VVPERTQTSANCVNRAEAKPDPADALDYLRRLAETLILSVEPIRFSVANTTQERAAVYRLRYAAVIDRGWAIADDLPNGIERDEWDERATYVGGWLSGDLVACARIIFPLPGEPLPVETLFDLTVEPEGHVAQVDRVVVARNISSGDHRILWSLFARSWLETHARGWDVLAGLNSLLMIRLYKAAGLQVDVLGPGQTYWAEERFPVRFDVPASVATVIAKWEKLLRSQPQESGGGGARSRAHGRT